MKQTPKRGVWLNREIPFRVNWMLHAVIVVFVSVWTWLAAEPSSRFDWFLENLLVWAALLLLAGTYRRFVFSNLSYVLIALFLFLHVWGAHYAYNETLAGAWMKEWFHTERNHYDRLVHFSYGLLLAYPIREALKARTGLGKEWLYTLTCTIVLASGAFYELIEMWVANIVAPEIGTLFLGTQGDPWDAQHDMELALYGSIAAMLITAMCGRIERKMQGGYVKKRLRP